MLITTIAIAVLSLAVLFLSIKSIGLSLDLAGERKLSMQREGYIKGLRSFGYSTQEALVSLVKAIPASMIKKINVKLEKMEYLLARVKNEDGKMITRIESVTDETVDLEEEEIEA